MDAKRRLRAFQCSLGEDPAAEADSCGSSPLGIFVADARRHRALLATGEELHQAWHECMERLRSAAASPALEAAACATLEQVIEILATALPQDGSEIPTAVLEALAHWGPALTSPAFQAAWWASGEAPAQGTLREDVAGRHLDGAFSWQALQQTSTRWK